MIHANPYRPLPSIYLPSLTVGFGMQNAEIARLLTDVADLLEISAGNPFKVRAYRNAARTVADHPDPIAELVSGGEFDLTDLPGIGGGIAKEITALVQTGTLPQRQQLVATVPPGLLELLRIPGLGPKRVKLFHEKLKVNSVADLKDALEKGKIAKLGGFGPKLLEKIREGVTGGGPRRGERRPGGGGSRGKTRGGGGGHPKRGGGAGPSSERRAPPGAKRKPARRTPR